MGAVCNNSSPQCLPGSLRCVLLRRHWTPGMASHPSTFIAISSVSGWGVHSGDGNFAYSQVAALLLTEGQQPPSLSTCDSLSVTLVWCLVFTMLTEECGLCDKKKKKKGDDCKWYGSLCIAQWSGIVWFGKEMLTCAWIQQGFIKSVPCAGTVLASAGTKALLIYALRSSEHRGETDNEEPHCYLIWSMKEKKHQVKY